MTTTSCDRTVRLAIALRQAMPLEESLGARTRAQLREGQNVLRPIDVEADAVLADDHRLYPAGLRGPQVRMEAVVPEGERHRGRRTDQNRVRAEIVMGGRNGE